MSEERKMVETEKLLNTISRMQGTAFQPMTMGPDGQPVPLFDEIQRRAHETPDAANSASSDAEDDL